MVRKDLEMQVTDSRSCAGAPKGYGLYGLCPMMPLKVTTSLSCLGALWAMALWLLHDGALKVARSRSYPGVLSGALWLMPCDIFKGRAFSFLPWCPLGGDL